MKLILLFLALMLSLPAQDSYERGKIDMHGGSQDSYNSIGGYKNGGFQYTPLNMSKLLDKNTTKNAVKNTTKK